MRQTQAQYLARMCRVVPCSIQVWASTSRQTDLPQCNVERSRLFFVGLTYGRITHIISMFRHPCMCHIEKFYRTNLQVNHILLNQLD